MTRGRFPRAICFRRNVSSVLTVKEKVGEGGARHLPMESTPRVSLASARPPPSGLVIVLLHIRRGARNGVRGACSAGRARRFWPQGTSSSSWWPQGLPESRHMSPLPPLGGLRPLLSGNWASMAETYARVSESILSCNVMQLGIDQSIELRNNLSFRQTASTSQAHMEAPRHVLVLNSSRRYFPHP